MLVAFFKAHDDKDVKCEVVKFVDRLWLSESDEIICVRTFIVKVNDSSPFPLRHLRMLVPFEELPDLKNLANTCLDENVFFNNVSVGSENSIKMIEPDGHFGLIFHDSFDDVIVRTDDQLKSYAVKDCPSCRTIAIDFPDNPLEPGKTKIFRLSFTVTSLLDELSPRVKSLKFSYFEKAKYLSAFAKFDIDNLEIPVKKLYDIDTRQGGFDIFLQLPASYRCNQFNELTQTFGRSLPNGTIGNETYQKFIWRARDPKLVSPAVNILKAGETPIEMAGLLTDSFEMEEIRRDIKCLEDDSRKNYRLGLFAIFISIISILVAYIL